METAIKVFLIVASLLISAVVVFDMYVAIITLEPAMGTDGGFYDR